MWNINSNSSEPSSASLFYAFWLNVPALWTLKCLILVVIQNLLKLLLKVFSEIHREEGPNRVLLCITDVLLIHRDLLCITDLWHSRCPATFTLSSKTKAKGKTQEKLPTGRVPISLQEWGSNPWTQLTALQTNCALYSRRWRNPLQVYASVTLRKPLHLQ